MVVLVLCKPVTKVNSNRLVLSEWCLILAPWLLAQLLSQPRTPQPPLAPLLRLTALAAPRPRTTRVRRPIPAALPTFHWQRPLH